MRKLWTIYCIIRSFQRWVFMAKSGMKVSVSTWSTNYEGCNFYNNFDAKPHLTCGEIFDWETQFINISRTEKLSLIYDLSYPQELPCPRYKVEILNDNQFWFMNDPDQSVHRLVLLKSRNGSWPMIYYEESFSALQLIAKCQHRSHFGCLDWSWFDLDLPPDFLLVWLVVSTVVLSQPKPGWRTNQR